MLEIPVSVTRYLARVLVAARESGHAGLVVIVARDADAGELLDQVTEAWGSIHSVTGHYFAVVCPTPRRHDGFEYVASPHAPEAIVTKGINILGGGGKHWDSAFWYGSELLRSTDPEDPVYVGARITGSRPGKKGRIKHAFTAAASDIAALFGLPESLIPCVLVFSLWEERTIVIPTAREFRVYKFLKTLAEQFEESGRKLDRILDDVALAEKEYADVALPLEREAGRRQRAYIRISAEWDVQIRSICDHLRYAVPIVPGIDPLVGAVDASLHSAHEEPAAAIQILAKICSILEAEDTWQRGAMAGRLDSKLRHALKKIRDGFPEERAAAARLEVSRAKLAATGLPARVAEQHAALQAAKQSIKLSSFLTESLTAIEIRRTTLPPLAARPWPIVIAQGGSDSAVSLPLDHVRS